MYYIRRTTPNHGNPINQPFSGCVSLPDSLLSDYLETRGFCDIIVDNDNNTVTSLHINQEAFNDYLSKYPDSTIELEKETTIEDLKKENKLLKAQLQAQTDRSDFIEDCIAEMAGVVYNTEETTT